MKKKIAIVGGGIIGMTLANYIDRKKYQVTLFDEPTGQATKASAGIISPWLSKRRNHRWYHLAVDGAAFFDKLITDFQLDETIYHRCSTLILRKEAELEELIQLAEQRKKNAPEIGVVENLSSAKTKELLPLLKAMPSIKISGGGRLDGKAYLQKLKTYAQKNGIDIINERITLKKGRSHWQINTPTQIFEADEICLTPGAGLKTLLAPLDYQVDIRPQKGQLLVFDTNLNTNSWPVAMLDGESDLIPFKNGKILLGATHENNEGFDLTETTAAKTQLMASAQSFLENPQELFSSPIHYRVGTRAYTSDFAPFFGPVTDDPSLTVASGLGSSGLTTGPYIGYLLAEFYNNGQWLGSDYQKPLQHYIKKESGLQK